MEAYVIQSHFPVFIFKYYMTGAVIGGDTKEIKKKMLSP